jgi:hypothetical protein
LKAKDIEEVSAYVGDTEPELLEAAENYWAMYNDDDIDFGDLMILCLDLNYRDNPD